jgi:ferritin
MLSKALQDAVNEQIKHELQSAYLYLGMSLYTESINLSGFAAWLRVQWQEELGHAMKLMDIVHDRDGRVTLQAIEKPPAEYKSPLDVFQQVLAHEQKITASVNRLYESAIKENDYAAQVEIQWFIKEQVEEEKKALAIVEQLKMIGESGTPLLMIDRQLAARSAGH